MGRGGFEPREIRRVGDALGTRLAACTRVSARTFCYVLRLTFSDGTRRDVDLEPDLWGPVFEPLRDHEVFRQVAVDSELGTIVWPNGADMDPDGLHATGSPRCT
jgi:hypothetical protein